MTAPPITPKPYPTAEEVAALFTKWGLRPVVHHFVDEHTSCGCADGVLLIEFAGGIQQAFNARKMSDSCTALAELTGWPDAFIDGISHGFFGHQSRAEDEGNPRYMDGFRLGMAVHVLVFPGEVDQ